MREGKRIEVKIRSNGACLSSRSSKRTEKTFRMHTRQRVKGFGDFFQGGRGKRRRERGGTRGLG